MTTRMFLNGAPPTTDDLRAFVLNNYGHFTAMRVSDGALRGLDLHLQRLREGTRDLFSSDLDTEHVRKLLRDAIDGEAGEWSVRINVFSRNFNRERPSSPTSADVLVSVSPATTPASTPLRVKSYAYERDAPHVKHVGTFPLFHFRKLAQSAGFDDAVFVDRSGAVSEGSIWNIGFVDDDDIVWTDAPQLEGVSKQLLREGIAELGLRQYSRRVVLSDLSQFRCAFFTNAAQAVRPIASIDDVSFSIDPHVFSILADCYDRRPLQRI